MKRLPASGNVIVTGPASKSNTDIEIKRVAIGAHDGPVNWIKVAVMHELAETAILDDCPPVHV